MRARKYGRVVYRNCPIKRFTEIDRLGSVLSVKLCFIGVNLQGRVSGCASQTQP